MKTTENERYGNWDIRNGVELPLAGCAILVITDGAPLVFVMVYFADEQRHAQVEQANDDGTKAVFHDATHNLNLRLQNVKSLARCISSGEKSADLLGLRDPTDAQRERRVAHVELLLLGHL